MYLKSKPKMSRMKKKKRNNNRIFQMVYVILEVLVSVKPLEVLD